MFKGVEQQIYNTTHEYSIMERFCYEIKDAELSSELLFQIRGSGAFQRFKYAIHRYNIADSWYRYRQKALFADCN